MLRRLYKRLFGMPVFEIPSTTKAGMDAWTRRIVERSGERVWWEPGHDRKMDTILTRGDVRKVADAIRVLMGENPRLAAWNEGLLDPRYGPTELRYLDQGGFVLVEFVLPL